MLPFKVLQRPGQSSVTHVYVDLDEYPEVNCFFRSDTHHDSTKCLRDAEMAHLNECLGRNAGIFDFGDTFCAMQSKFDRRSSKSNLRDEHQRDDYLDVLVSTTAKDYRPYAQQFAFLARGNHETSVLDKYGVDLTNRLAEELQEMGSPVQVGHYQGYVHFHFKAYSSRVGGYKVRYTHGYGGGGPVTKDTIQLNRQLVFLEDVDMVVSGHTHDKWHVQQRRERLSDDGHIRYRTVDALKLGTYLDAFTDGMGWCVEKGHPPRSVGGWWVKFYKAWSNGKTSGHNGRKWRYQITDAQE